MTVMPTSDQCKAHVERVRVLVDEALPMLVNKCEPESLYQSVQYVLDGGGKRFRPILCLLAAEMFDVEARTVLPAALAVEVFHNFTLVHDDVMDHADSRRGRPTVHVKWDESTAILCGDFLMSLAYDLLSRLDTVHLSEIVRAFNRMVVRLCEGQAFDTQFGKRNHVAIEDYLQMIDGKTGALLATSLELGGLIGRADHSALQALQETGRHLGRAFQIQDDLLDLTAKDERWGKAIGGDLMEGKRTYLLLRTIERSNGENRVWFERIINDGGIPQEEVLEARERMAHLGVLEEAERVVIEYSSRAETCLTRLPRVAAVETLRWLIHRMKARMF